MRRTTLPAFALIACLALNLCAILPISSRSQGKGQVQPISPLDIGTPAAWYDAGLIGQADNTAVSQWNDLSGNGRHLLQATGGNQPTLQTSEVAGRSIVRFDGADDFMKATFTLNQPWTIFMVMKRYAEEPPARYFDGATVNGGFIAQNAVSGVGQATMYAGSFIVTGYGLPIGEYSVIRGTFNGASSSMSQSTRPEYTGSIGTAAAGGITIAAAGNNALTFNAQIDVAEVIVYSSAVSPANTSRIYDYLGQKYHLYQQIEVFFEGDSLTEGAYCSITPYPTLALAALGTAYKGVNLGESGDTLATMVSEGEATIDTNISGHRPKNIVVVWGGTNDLYFGTAVSTVKTSAQTFISARVAAGFQVVFVTMLPRSGAGTPGGFEAARQTFNTDMKAWCVTNNIVVADVAADTRIGDAGDSDDTSYYCDKTHLNATGNQIATDIIVTGIQSLP